MAHAGSTYAPRAESAGTSERVEPLKGWSRPHLARNRRGRRLAARIAWVHGGRGRSRRLRRTYAKIGSSHSIAVTLVQVGQSIAVRLALPS